MLRALSRSLSRKGVKYLSLLISYFLVMMWGTSLTWAEGSINYTLNDCLQLALKQNLELMIARKNLTSAELDWKETLATNSWQVNLQGGPRYSELNISRDIIEPENFISSLTLSVTDPLTSFSLNTQTYEGNYQWGLSAARTLYDGYPGGRSQATIQQAEKGFDQKKMDILRSQKDIVYQTKQVFFQLIQMQKSLDVNRQSFSYQQKQLERTRAFYESGMVPYLSVLEAETVLKEIELEMLRGENNLRLSRWNLNYLLGLPEDTELSVIEEKGTSFPTLDFSLCLEEAFQSRIEFQQLGKTRDLQEINLRLTQSQKYPVVSLKGNVEWQSQGLPDSYDWDVELSLTFPLWDSKARDFGIQKARLEIEKIALEEEKLRRSIYREVQEAYLQYQEALKNLELISKKLEEALEEYRLVENKAQMGLATPLDLMDAENNLREVRVEEIASRCDGNISLALLEKSIGR